jgi:uncharacterized protein (DUF433 family)/DNA-binding transcriptional MerR regulator
MKIKSSPALNQTGRGVYEARRAAALSGVPERTLHYWASHNIYEPTINPEPRTRLWSWSDLLALRAIDWFRKKKENGSAPSVSMNRIRQMLVALQETGQSREDLHRIVAVAQDGELFLRFDDEILKADGSGQTAIPGAIPLIQPYFSGPDLLRPRPLLRIIPGKLHGEPHVENTRVGTAVLFELTLMGYRDKQILEMYPGVSLDAFQQALDLERSLETAA